MVQPGSPLNRPSAVTVVAATQFGTGTEGRKKTTDSMLVDLKVPPEISGKETLWN
jgi:hypothetical protein